MRVAAGIDIETTGLSQEDGHRMVEVGIRLYNFDNGEFIVKFVQRLNPQRPIDPKAQAVHGISFEDVADCMTWEEYAPRFVKIMSKVDVLIAHNGESFDLPFINGELIRVGQPVLFQPLIDTMLKARWATPMGKYPNLGELCFACGVDYDPSKAHGADYDIDVMCQCYFKYKDYFGDVNVVPR